MAAVLAKMIELGVSFLVLAGLMIWYRMMPTADAVWVPVIVGYTVFVSLCVGFIGAAMNVYYRDVSRMLPVALSLLMYASPIIYPLSLVQNKLMVQQAPGSWSNAINWIYMANPMAGIIDSFQRVLLKGTSPDLNAVLPGFMVTLVLLPISYHSFKRAESYFADVI